MENTNDLESSELGTKEYWDDSYLKEIKNYNSHGDPGEVWFDESSQFRVINWLQKKNSAIDKNDSILDLGNK